VPPSRARQPTIVGWPAIRHGVVFVLGSLVILDAITTPGDDWPSILIGAVMVGVLPLDRLVLALRDDRVGGRGRRGITPRDKTNDE